MGKELKPGSLLREGNYRIECAIGQSDIDFTYIAEDLSLDRKVVIKELFPMEYCSRDAAAKLVPLDKQFAKKFFEKLKAKFLCEARNIARLNHPGIIKIHAAFEENNTAYYVMDFIEGEFLCDKVRKNGPLSADVALRYIKKVGDALSCMHSHKLNHLDIVPDNIVVRSSDDTPILLDFGQAKLYYSFKDELSLDGQAHISGFCPLEMYKMGTVNEFNPQTDIYFLASTLYYLLLGLIPPNAAMLSKRDLAFPSWFPEGFIMPVKKAMSSELLHRQQTVKDFCDQLVDAIGFDEDTIFEQEEYLSTEGHAVDDKFGYNRQDSFKDGSLRENQIFETESANTYHEMNKSKSWKEMNRQEKIETLKKEWRQILIAIICIIMVLSLLALLIYLRL